MGHPPPFTRPKGISKGESLWISLLAPKGAQWKALLEGLGSIFGENLDTERVGETPMWSEEARKSCSGQPGGHIGPRSDQEKVGEKIDFWAGKPDFFTWAGFRGNAKTRNFSQPPEPRGPGGAVGVPPISNTTTRIKKNESWRSYPR